MADALFNALADSKDVKADVMGTKLRAYGFDVTRFPCSDRPTIACHSMKVYEEKTAAASK